MPNAKSASEKRKNAMKKIVGSMKTEKMKIRLSADGRNILLLERFHCSSIAARRAPL
jgi:hypothetical protein